MFISSVLPGQGLPLGRKGWAEGRVGAPQEASAGGAGWSEARQRARVSRGWPSPAGRGGWGGRQVSPQEPG